MVEAAEGAAEAEAVAGVAAEVEVAAEEAEAVVKPRHSLIFIVSMRQP